MSFIGNYLWTHYFYIVLGAKYTFPSWRLNDVPIPLILITHAYFSTYHVLSNLVLRKVWALFHNKTTAISVGVLSLVIFTFSYLVAFMETFSIQQFPYYSFPDRNAMYLYGSVFFTQFILLCPSLPFSGWMNKRVNAGRSKKLYGTPWPVAC